MAGAFDNLLRWIDRNPGKTALAIGGAAALGAIAGAGAAGVLPGVIPGQGHTLGNGPALAPGAWSSNTPRRYAASKVAHAISDWNGALGAAVRTMAPQVFPGADPTVFLGFTSNGAQFANTAAANANSFAEMGWFGITGGPRSTPPATGPYPFPTPVHGSENDWLDLHATQAVVSLLGHPATMAHNAWQRAVLDQTAVGLVSLKQHRERTNAAIPVACRSNTMGSPYSVALAMAGWSAGNSRFASQIRTFQAQIGAVPEAQKFNAWIAAVVAAARAGTITGAAASHNRASYTCLRTLQKIETGRLLAERLGLPTTWYPVVSDHDQDVITASAYGAPV